MRLAALVSVFLFLTSCAWMENTAEVRRLRTEYPHVKYLGPKSEPEVTLKKDRPSSWTSFHEVSKVAIGAVIVSEDWAFYQHKGIDTAQIKEAIKEDLEAGSFKRGASTITQQVAKNVFLSNEKTLTRKFREVALATSLEKHLTKRKILELYFNIAEWGEGIYGIKTASRFYFGKLPGELSAKEGAFLAMLLPSPKRYSQSFRNKKLTAYAVRTMRTILRKMEQAGYLESGGRNAAWAQRLSFEEGEVLKVPAESNDNELEESGPIEEETTD